MVNADGQLYTIEGIAAGLMLLMTAYIVVNSTSVYTPGDTHISDMQLEVLGSDALSMMNTAPNGSAAETPLQTIVETGDATTFSTLFLNTIDKRADVEPDTIQFLANVTYVSDLPGNPVNSTPLSASPRPFSGTEHAVRVSEWVIVEKQFPDCHATSCKRKHAALVEVLLWRD